MLVIFLSCCAWFSKECAWYILNPRAHISAIISGSDFFSRSLIIPNRRSNAIVNQPQRLYLICWKLYEKSWMLRSIFWSHLFNWREGLFHFDLPEFFVSCSILFLRNRVVLDKSFRNCFVVMNEVVWNHSC